MTRSFLNFRFPSLLRANLLVLGSLAAAFKLAGFPAVRPSFDMVFPILFASLGMAETFRCLRARWSFYHGAVMISLYMDAMALTMIVFLALYPFLTLLQ